MSTSSNKISVPIIDTLKSFPIFRSIKNGLRLSPLIQVLSSKIDDEALSDIMEDLAMCSLIGILYQPTQSGVAKMMKKLGDKSKEDSPAKNPPDKPSQEVSGNVPTQDGPAENL